MAEIKLFAIGNEVEELVSSKVLLEKELQNLIEANMETFFGVRFLKSEYVITSGRIDSIGIDENNSPVIFEYKRSQNENVINQGLFYLDWLLDHKGEFTLLVQEKLGMKAAESIDWSVPSVFCVAHDFTQYDVHAINQMQRNIKLVCYRKYNDLILFEYINAPKVKPITADNQTKSGGSKYSDKNHVEKLAVANADFKEIYYSLCDYIESLGDEITSNQLKYYLAYKKVQNFVCIQIYKSFIHLYLKLDPKSVEIEEGFTRDVTNVGHYGTGDLEVCIRGVDDFEKAKLLINRAYYES